jgi:hypothetical protein
VFISKQLKIIGFSYFTRKSKQENSFMREGKYRKIKDTGKSREEMTKKEKMKRRKQ